MFIPEFHELKINSCVSIKARIRYIELTAPDRFRPVASEVVQNDQELHEENDPVEQLPEGLLRDLESQLYFIIRIACC